MPVQMTSNSLIILSIAISLIALSTILCTSSSKLCKFKDSKSAKVVSSLMTNLTLVAETKCCQCRSRIAGFCNSPTALKDVNMFFTVTSKPRKASQLLMSLSRPRMSLENFLHSISMFSTSMFFHCVVFHSSMEVLTKKM